MDGISCSKGGSLLTTAAGIVASATTSFQPLPTCTLENSHLCHITSFKRQEGHSALDCLLEEIENEFSNSVSKELRALRGYFGRLPPYEAKK